jgi:hypothetical protein
LDDLAQHHFEPNPKELEGAQTYLSQNCDLDPPNYLELGQQSSQQDLPQQLLLYIQTLCTYSYSLVTF